MPLLSYPKCTTCKKAKTWLQMHCISYTTRHIKEQPPTAEELHVWQQKSGLPLKRFFNTSGMRYRELGLKDKLSGMSEEEQFALLSGDGMLIKRPLLILENTVLVGFREAEWQSVLGLDAK